MASVDRVEHKEKPFEGKKVYYSGSIRGIANSDPNFAWNLVQHMINNGANVLDEHVGARNREEMAEIFYKRSGIEIGAIEDKKEKAKVARRQDLKWDEEDDYLVALVTSPSLGVGIEIQHAILKPRLGLNKTPILFLVDRKVVDADMLSNMVTGIDSEAENVDYEIGIYENEEDAKRIITEFLISH